MRSITYVTFRDYASKINVFKTNIFQKYVKRPDNFSGKFRKF